MKPKKFALGGLALAAALVLAACSSGGDPANNETTGSTSTPPTDDKITVAFVPKVQGIPYFEAMNDGGKRAEAELGITWLYQGPTTADAAAQADIVRSMIQQKVNALVVAPNDPDSMAPLLKEAQDAGIAVLTSDTDAPNSVRSIFVNQASEQGIGEGLVEALVGAMGDSGKYAIVSCGETAANLNAWIEVQKAYSADKYPNLELVDTVYAGEDQAAAAAMATNLISAHPDLKGLVGECTTSAPGVAQAVRDAGKIGQIFTVGLDTPNDIKPYLEDGSSSAAILWDVPNLGYLTAWAGLQAAQGKTLSAGVQTVSSDITAATGDPATKVLLLGPALELTKDNVGNYDY
ncbi:MAG: autoinducer 2 ABC transporter substrate-binding protein [Propionibacteriaceae bacterium]|jgi:rhamnose transport system substrate-binding protein|nr:autoinducer 2 ABC transporter substrate-binding protein [Propionibacteriaceae bacterium]